MHTRRDNSDQAPAALDYPARPNRPARLSLDLQEENGQLKVLFPEIGRWFPLVVLGIVICFGVGVAMMGLHDLLAGWQMRGGVSFDKQDLILLAAKEGVCILLAVLAWLAYRKWTREVEVITVTRDGVHWSRLGIVGRRSYWWAADEIESVGFGRSWGNIAVIGAAGFLILRVNTGRQQRFYLSSPDRRLPRTIVERIAAVLEKPMR